MRLIDADKILEYLKNNTRPNPLPSITAETQQEMDWIYFTLMIKTAETINNATV